MSRTKVLSIIAQLRDTANKKHNESTSAMKKLDYYLAYLQLKTLLEHERKFKLRELQVIPDQYSRINE